MNYKLKNSKDIYIIKIKSNDMTLAEMDALWDEAKSKEKNTR